MLGYIHWIIILATTLSTFHEVKSKDDSTIEILFVNDMQYGFYPIDITGSACADDGHSNCKGGLARIMKALETTYPPPTTPTTTTATTPTTSTATTPTTSTVTTPTTSTTTTKTETLTSKPSNQYGEPSSLTNNEGGNFIDMKYRTVGKYGASGNIYFPDNTLFLNAGNYLHSSSNNWFDLLKFDPAVDALNSIPFSAIAMGPDVLQYGESKATDFVSKVAVKVLAANVLIPSKEDIIKSKSFEIPSVGVSVTVIGFLGAIDKEKYYGGINVTDTKIAIEEELKKQKAKENQIFIAIGAANDDLATEIAKIDGMNVVIYSGSNKTDDITLRKITKSSWIATSKPPAALEPHGIIGKVTIQLNEKLISEVNIDKIVYTEGARSEDGKIKTFEETGYLLLKTKTAVALAKTQTALGDNDTCSALEYGLGDLVTDAMKRAMEDKNYEDGIAMWNLQYHPSPIEADKDFSEEELYVLLGKGNDENMYVVPLKPTQIANLLEESIDNLNNKDCSSMQISGLYIDYGSWEPKGKRIKRIRLLTGKGFKDLDLKENKNLNVIVPSHLMNKLNSSSNMEVSDLGTSVGEAVVGFIKQTKFKNNNLYMPPVGTRFTEVKPPPENKKCENNVGEAVILTLGVEVIIAALGLVTWYFIIPRIRQRRGSSAPLIY